MPARPFRFIHATNLRLDQPLWGIGTVAADARRIAEDATLSAFEQIIEACIQHRVAFLLLTGNCFDAAHAYRARMTLEDCCARLAEHQIEVFIIPGESDPAPAWVNSFQLPRNVTTFVTRDSEAVAVVRDSEVLATVEQYAAQPLPREQKRPSSALRIALVGAGQHSSLQQLLSTSGGSMTAQQLGEHPAVANIGYLALGNGRERFTVNLSHGLAHDPGCPQPLDGRQTAAAGCSLVEVDRAGKLQITPLPTAVVRREEITCTLTGETGWDELAQQMQTALLERDPLPTERLWLVRWIIDGSGPLAESLTDAAAQQELYELVEQELNDDRGLIRQHEIEVRTFWRSGDADEPTGSIFEEFTDAIDERLKTHVDQFRRRLPTIDWPEAGWVRHVVDAGERLSSSAVAAHARTMARRHLHSSRDARR